MRILIADDDTKRAEGLITSLCAIGHSVEHANREERVEAALEANPFDLVILHLGLGEVPGSDLVTRIRRCDAVVPLLAMARGTGAQERIEAMDQGADDCVSAPISADEVKALVRVWYRRTLGSAKTIVKHGPLSFDASDRAVYIEGEPVRLSRREVSIFEILLQRKGRVVSKDHLMDCLFEWGKEVSGNSIEVYVHRLRKKIERGCVHIETLRGQGYRLEPISA